MPRGRTPENPEYNMEDLDTQTEDATTQHVASLKAQVQTLDAVMPACKGQDNVMATKVLEGVKEQKQQLRIEITKAKPLDAQVHTLEELVSRKTTQLQDAAKAVQAANKAHKQLAAELKDAKKELEEAKQFLLTEKENDKGISDGLTASQLRRLRDMTLLLPTEHAEQAQLGLSLLLPLLKGDGMTPGVTPAASEERPARSTPSPTPLAPRSGQRRSRSRGEPPATTDPYMVDGSPRTRARCSSTGHMPRRRRIIGKSPAPQCFQAPRRRIIGKSPAPGGLLGPPLINLSSAPMRTRGFRNAAWVGDIK